MSLLTFKIELRVDYNRTSKETAIEEAVTTISKELLATASLLSDGRQPKLVITKTPFFGAPKTVELKPEDI